MNKPARWMILLIALALVGCSRSTIIEDGVAPETPEAAHSQWVTAVRDNKRQAALALTSGLSDNQALFVDQTLSRMQDIIKRQSNGVIRLGPLQRVEVLTLSDEGTGKVGLSAWRFEQHTFCYQTWLALHNGAWGVTGWGQMLTCRSGGVDGVSNVGNLYFPWHQSDQAATRIYFCTQPKCLSYAMIVLRMKPLPIFS